MRKSTAAVACAVVTWVGCGSGPAPTCPAGSPEAIFEASDPGVAEHSFRGAATGAQTSVESIDFEDGSHLEIEQFGCDTLGQTFLLSLPTGRGVAEWAEWRDLASAQFRSYAALDERLVTFGEYARALESVPKDFPMPQPANLAPGLTLRAYPVPGKAGSVWRVDLVQDLRGMK